MLENDFSIIDKMVGKYDKNLEPMIYCLNYCFSSNFLELLERIKLNQGFGGNNIGMFFPSDFEVWDEDYFETGVMFQWGCKGIIVDYSTFYKYLKRITNISIKLFPNTKEKANELLYEIKRKYSLNDNIIDDKIIKKLSFKN